MGCKMQLKKIYGILIIVMILAGFTPIVWAATEDTVIITFDPDGNIDIDISYSSYNYSVVPANSWKNTTGGYFTLYNNGSVPMTTQIKTNATTDEADMSLNDSGMPPNTDEYAIFIEDLDLPNYLNTSYFVFDTGLNAIDSKTFDICLLLGTNLSANHSWQTTTIYFRGSIS